MIFYPHCFSSGRISCGWFMDTAVCHPNNLRYCPMSPGWYNIIQTLSHLKLLAVSHLDDSWSMQDVIWMTYDVALCGWHNLVQTIRHPDELAPGRISSDCPMVNAMCQPDGLRCCHMSPGWHNVIETLSQPDKLAPGRISSGWLMNIAVCRPNDLLYCPMSFGWHNVIQTLS